MYLFRPARHGQPAHIPATTSGLARSGLLVLLLALGGILTGPTDATSHTATPDPTDGRPVDIPVEAKVFLELTPVDGDAAKPIWLGDSRAYKATAIVTVGPDEGTADNPDNVTYRVDVTGLTRFRLTQEGRRSGTCRRAICRPATMGEHTVTGRFPQWPGHLIVGTTTLLVRQPVERLRLEPPTGTVRAGDGMRYTAVGWTDDNQRLGDRSDQTDFTVTEANRPPVDCPGAICAPTTVGDHTVTGTFTEEGRDPVTGTATLTVVPGQPTSLRLDPESATVEVEVGQPFRAVGTDAYGNETDLSERVEFTIVRIRPKPAEGGSCVRVGSEERCTSATPGIYRITGTLNDPRLSASATLTVVPRRIEPSINTVDPAAASPNTEVVVTGTTGSCNRVGTLTVEQTDVRRRVHGDFETRFKVPPGTPPGDHPLRLDVACEKGRTKQATHPFRVQNQAPQPVDDPDAATLQDTAVRIRVTRNDHDPDDPDGYRTSLDPEKPEHGTAVALADNRVLYTPDDGFADVDRFRYHLCDIVDARGTRQCGTATVTVTVSRPEPVPVDDPDERTPRGRAVVIDVMGNDRHPDGSRLKLLPPERPGSRAEKLPDGKVRYTPAPDLVGQDRFRYDYCGFPVDAAGKATCPSATVTVTVTERPSDPQRPPAPVPVDDPDATTLRDRPVVVDVMANDRNPDAARLRVGGQPTPSGQAEKLADGTIRYTPKPGFVGEDRFEYDYCGSVADAGRQVCPSATVTVTVTSTPVITSIRPDSASPGTPVEVAGNTGSCGRAGTLTLRDTGAAVRVTGDQRGNFTARLTVPGGTSPRAYTLEVGVGCRGQTQRAQGLVTVTNQPPTALDDSATTVRDHAVPVPVTRNDRDPDDPDGYPTRVLVSTPINGSADLRPDDTVVYTPNAGFIGQDQFQYSLCDDILNVAGNADCGTATVTIAVTDTPVITSVSPGSGKPGTSITVAGSTGSCSRSGTLTLEETGVVARVSADQSGNFITVLTIPDGTYPRDYRLALRVDCAGRSQQAEGRLSVTNRPPDAVDDVADTISDTSVPIVVTDNDSDPDDPDSYPSRLLVLGQPGNGTAEVRSEQTIVYTPRQGFVGQDHFRYAVCDDILNAAGRADCGTASVTVTVADAGRCLSAGQLPSIRVTPGKGKGGAKLGITATVDRQLAACPFRLLLGGTPLGADVLAGRDGGITAQRAVPDHTKPGTVPVRLATMRGQVLTEVPFEVVGTFPWTTNPLVRVLGGAAALLAGGLARGAFRRWWPTGRDRTEQTEETLGSAEDVRAEPHTRPVEVAVERIHDDGTQTFTVRLEPHSDPGTQRMQEADR
jgi:Bacterial Ig domain